MLTQVESMWHRNFGSKEVMQHRIDLENTDIQPIYSAPYHAGPQARELEKQKMNQMLAMDVIGSAQTKWHHLFSLSK